MNKKLLVIKFGTASITKESGEPDKTIIQDIANQIAELHKEFKIVIVSSGAVGAGKRFIKNYEGQIAQKKAAAAIGNPILLTMYDEAFSKHGIQVAQSLLERQHFANREQFLQLKQTYEELWKNDVIPIANENDVVSNREIRFSDNDELATLVATLFDANRLMLCTASGGLLDSNNKLVPLVKEVDKTILSLVKSTKTALGSGGMESKLTFTKQANTLGIQVNIFGLKNPRGILKSFNGETGTVFLPQAPKINARVKWMSSAAIVSANVTVDKGAGKAILARKSLLAVGVVDIDAPFRKGDVLQIYEGGQLIAIGKSKINSEEFNLRVSPILIHADDLMIVGL
ncbi:MAG: glutamate 5-kinase [Leadbetterella sp.]